MAAVEAHGHVCAALGEFVDQDSQFLVGEVEPAGPSAVDADQPFVPSVGVMLAKGGGGTPPGTMAAVMEKCDVTDTSARQMLAKQSDNVGARGLVVLQDLQRQIALIRTPTQVGMQLVDVVDAAVKTADIGGVVVDADEQRVDTLNHCGTYQRCCPARCLH
jgi:hypothetical protein